MSIGEKSIQRCPLILNKTVNVHVSYLIIWNNCEELSFFLQELLEKALGGLLKKQDENCTNPRELDKLIQQQRTIERELSRVLQQLAEASKVLQQLCEL